MRLCGDFVFGGTDLSSPSSHIRSLSLSCSSNLKDMKKFLSLLKLALLDLSHLISSVLPPLGLYLTLILDLGYGFPVDGLILS